LRRISVPDSDLIVCDRDWRLSVAALSKSNPPSLRSVTDISLVATLDLDVDRKF
jgi:hypothetical protein